MAALAAVAYGEIFLALLPASAISGALARDVVFDDAALGAGQRFRADAPTLGALWIGFSSALAVIASRGMLLPWARVRWAASAPRAPGCRLRGRSARSSPPSPPPRGSLVGDAYADLEGVELGLPLRCPRAR